MPDGLGDRVYRALTIAVAGAALLPAGCANMWDAVTSRNFRDAPFKTVGKVISPEEPMVVLRADPPRSGDEQAKAMHRLKEPLRNKGTQADQDQVIELLTRTATTDNSPVLRYAAIEALGRFQDPRAPAVLVAAYQKAEGPKPPPFKLPSESAILQASGLSAGRAPTRAGGPEQYSLLTGPTGFPPDTVAALRCRCLESLGHTSSLEAARFLAAVAGASGPDVVPAGSNDPEVQQAAVRGLGQCRQPEAVLALAHVLNAQAGKDPPLARGAHQGLVRLTGKDLPPDPQKWAEVVQAGVTIAPEPTWFDNAVRNAAFWEKK
jgi:hypothetical protein